MTSTAATSNAGLLNGVGSPSTELSAEAAKVTAQANEDMFKQNLKNFKQDLLDQAKEDALQRFVAKMTNKLKRFHEIAMMVIGNMR